MAEQFGWVVSDNKTGDVTVEKAAAVGKQHVIFGIYGSFDATGDGLLVLKDGDAVIFSQWVYDKADIQFRHGIVITRGNAVSAVLEQGTTGSQTYLNLHGVTRG